jgi:hypothetical protein
MKRKKNGKIKGFTCHVEGIFYRKSSDEPYIEKAEIKIKGEHNLGDIIRNRYANNAIKEWIHEVIIENGYDTERIGFKADRWIPIR